MSYFSLFRVSRSVANTPRLGITYRCQQLTIRRSAHKSRSTEFHAELAAYSQVSSRIRVLRPAIIGLGVVFGAYAVAAHLTNRDTDFYLSQFPIGSRDGPWDVSTGSVSKFCYERHALGERIMNLRKLLQQYLPDSAVQHIISPCMKIANLWLFTQQADRLLLAITGAAMVVFFAWKIPATWPHMLKHWTHHPFSGLSHTLFTNSFSHVYGLHFTLNILVLWALKPALQWLSEDCFPQHLTIEEAPSVYHLAAVVFSAGVVSSLFSHFYDALRFRLRGRNLLPNSQFTNLEYARHTGVLPSVGLSGILCAHLTIMTYDLPSITIHFPLLDRDIQINFWMLTQFGMFLEIVGLLSGWGSVDFAAHLGGYAFGVFYAKYGLQCWQFTRLEIARLTGREIATVSLPDTIHPTDVASDTQ